MRVFMLRKYYNQIRGGNNMKVLVINGSPRGENSNSMCLTRPFLEGAGWTDAEIVNVSKLNVRGCLGCFACWSKTPGKCVIDDDMAGILPKLIEADVVIWSFPLYYYNVPGDLKNFIDRQLPLVLPEMSKDVETGGHPNRYDFSKQRHFVVSTCGFWTARGNYESVTEMFNRICGEYRYEGSGGYDRIFMGQGGLFNLQGVPEDHPQLAELKALIEPYFEATRRAGKEFAAGRISEETHALLAEPPLPKEVYEAEADASW